MPNALAPRCLSVSVSRIRTKWPLPLTAPVVEHLDALLSILETHAAGIRAVLSRFPAEIGCAIYFRTFTSGIHLPQQLLARVAALGLDIDFDLYFLGENDNPDDHGV